MSEQATEQPTGRGGVLRVGLLSMVGLVALGGTRLVHGSLVSRFADRETYGEVVILLGLAMTASLFLPGGLASAASRFIPFHRGRDDAHGARAAYHMITWAGLGCAALSGIVVGLIATTVPGVSTGDAVSVGALTAVFSSYSVAKGALYGFDRVVPYTWLEIAGAVVAIGVTTVVVATGSHQYLTPLTIGYGVLLLGSFVVLRRKRAESSRAVAGEADRVRSVATYVGLASLGGVASAGLLQVLPVFAGWFTTRAEVGYFGAAVALVAPLYFLPRALSMALFPAMAKAHGAGDAAAVRNHADVFTRALLVLLAPIFGAGILLAPELLAAFGGAGFTGGAAVLRVVLLATYVLVVQVAAVNSLSSGDSVRIPVYSAVGGAIVGLAVLAPLGIWLGATGVALAYLVAAVAGAGVPIAVVWRRYDLPWTGAVVRSLAVVLAAILAAALTEMRPYGGVRIAIDILVAAAVAAAGVLLLRRDISGILALRRTLG